MMDRRCYRSINKIHQKDEAGMFSCLMRIPQNAGFSFTERIRHLTCYFYQLTHLKFPTYRSSYFRTNKRIDTSSDYNTLSIMYQKKIIKAFTIICGLVFSTELNGQESGFNASEKLLQVQALLISETEMDTIVDKVLRSSYRLKMYDAEVASLNEEKKIESRSWMRSLTIGVNMFGYNVTPSTLEETSTTQLSVLSNASVTLLISPFELIGQKNRIKRAQYRVIKQEMVLEDSRREAKIFITKKFLDYQAALEAYILNENNLMISKELKHVADEEFKRGVISNTEYNQILGGVMQNRLNLLEAENAVMKLKFELEILMKD
ncbi:MAG: TolC family protein [Ekhidna sp.]|nr:TolC family protein [Ekhidna sp.]